MSPELESLGERFWLKVDRSGECWVWTGRIVRGGYGQFKVSGKLKYVHRLTFIAEYGPILDGLVIDHMCHNPACVKPSHLRQVTNKQNGENRQGPQRGSTSGILGVSWHSGNRKWAAAVRHNDVRYHLGSFADKHEAEAVVVAKRLELFTHNDMDRSAQPTHTTHRKATPA